MNFFTPVEDGFVLLRSRGVFKQAPLFERGEKLYAGWGSGFIGLLHYQKATTQPNVAWVEISLDAIQQVADGYIGRG